MKKIYIRLDSTGKIYTYESNLKVKANDSVLVENDQIIEKAEVIEKPTTLSSAEEGTGKILRIINAEDCQFCEALKNQAGEFIAEAQKKVFRHGLTMKILDADLSFDQKKLTFYFSAKGRVDFRGLVLDMAKSFNKLIRLQQVSGRSEAKYFGGIGKCGRELCCRAFFNSPEMITLEMAEAQEMSTLGTSKISGCCGKLMCCLAFEKENYPSSQSKILKGKVKKEQKEKEL